MHPHSTTLAIPCQCGCGGIVRPGKRFLQGHWGKTQAKPLAQRFWEKVQKTNDCWLWTGALAHGCYGHLTIRGHGGPHIQAHRLSWELHFSPIPDGLLVCHHCDTPRCVRPDHLFLGTDKDNTQDMMRKGRFGFPNRKHPAIPSPTVQLGIPA